MTERTASSAGTHTPGEIGALAGWKQLVKLRSANQERVRDARHVLDVHRRENGQSVSVALAGAIFASLGGAAAGLQLSLHPTTHVSALQQIFSNAFHVAFITCAAIAGIGVLTSFVRGKGRVPVQN